MEDTEFCHEIIQAVLAKSLSDIVEDLEPDGVLDEFVSNDVFNPRTKTIVRDIREEAKTSDKNRRIQEQISSNPNVYGTFKLGLTNTKQDKLIEILENHEKEEHDSRKEHCNCSSTTDCELLKSLRCQRSLNKTPTRSVIDSLPQPKVQPEKITEQDISNLRASLIDQYRATALQVRSPVVPEDLGLDRVYVDPAIKVLREKTDPDSVLVNVEDQTVPANVSRCCRLFYTNNYRCKNIYICGDAGTGKSTFCKHLVNIWCKAHREESDQEDSDSKDYSDSGRGGHQREASKTKKRQSYKEEDRRIMSEFELLFYIKLRDSSDLYLIADMIDFQILQEDEDTKHFKASVLLQKVCCLVIVDGLDEWVCPENANVSRDANPGIPGRNRSNKNTTFLTTTRPWKFDVLRLISSEVDKHAALAGFDDSSSKRLCSKIIKVLNKSENKRRTKREFWAELAKKNLAHLITVPIVLTQLVCLWFDKKDLGQSQVQLYCNMLEMLLERPDKASQTYTAAPINKPTKTLLPKCFSNHPYCRGHQQLLLSLSKLAFESLFDQRRENALVFKSSEMEICELDGESINLFLESGILSQNKVLGKQSRSEKKMSFLHKKLQEFLAALFMVNRENADIVASRVKTFCTSVDTMLEMSQVWMFVSGIRPAMSRQVLSEVLSHVESVDGRLQQDRQTLTLIYRWSATALKRSIQTCIAGCVEEARSNGHRDLRLPLHDFVIENDTISECLENLITSNFESVKSVYIDTNYMKGQAVGRVGRIVGQLQDTRLQKLVLNDYESVISDVEKMLGETLTANKRHLTCLQLRNISLTGETPADVWDVVTNLTALNLFRVKLTHERREQLLLSVSRAAAMRQLWLWRLRCTDHGDECQTVLDLSGCTLLQILYLVDIYIAKMAAVANYVEDVRLSCVTIPGRQLEPFVRELSSASRPLTVGLYRVTVTGASWSRVDLTYLRHRDNVEVTGWDYDGGNFISEIKFQSRQQTTSDPDNQPQTSTP